jgi:flagellar biosynthesis GTPase FlhF
MNKRLIILLSLSVLGFCFLGDVFACAISSEVEAQINKLKEDIRTQEEVIKTLSGRYNVILKQKEELQNYINQETRRIEQIKKEKEAKQSAELKEKEAKRLELERQKQREIKIQEALKRAEAKQKEMEKKEQLRQKDLHNKYVLELDALIKKQKRLFEEGKKLEIGILREEENLKALEVNKNSIIEKSLKN